MEKQTLCGLRAIVRTLGARALLTALVATVVFGICAVAQGIGQVTIPVSPSFVTSTTSDPWFWAMVGAWLFSSLVSGMPEPEKSDSPFYVWIYRSFHIIAASGTSYFQHKSLWPTPEQMRSVIAPTVAQAAADRAAPVVVQS